MPKIHFVDGTYIDLYTISYEDFIDQLTKIENEKFITVNDITINIEKITYIENFEVVA